LRNLAQPCTFVIMSETPAQSPWMTRSEAATYLRVSPATVDRWVREERLEAFKVAGTQSVRFSRAGVEALIAPEGDE
jgi:excisionase family DNA binding protein